MRVLVTYADDSSADTARLIGDTLVLHGFGSVVRPVEAAAAEPFDAVVLGGTARAGQLPRLHGVPVWQFGGRALCPGDPAGPGSPPDDRSFRDTAGPDPGAVCGWAHRIATQLQAPPRPR